MGLPRGQTSTAMSTRTVRPQKPRVLLPTSFPTTIPYKQESLEFPEEIDDCKCQARDCLDPLNFCLYRCTPIEKEYHTNEMILDRMESKINLVLLICSSQDETQTLLDTSTRGLDSKTLYQVNTSFVTRQPFSTVCDLVFRNIAEK